MLMSNRKLLGLIAVVSMLTLTFVSCEEGSTPASTDTKNETSVTTEVSLSVPHRGELLPS